MPDPDPRDLPVKPPPQCPPHSYGQVGTDDNGQPKYQCRNCGAWQ